MQRICVSCNTEISEIAKFCPQCGAQKKCKVCDTPVIQGAKHCIECGVSLSFLQINIDNNKAVNTIKFKETATERSYELGFTDVVGASIGDVVKSMIENKYAQLQTNNSIIQLGEDSLHSNDSTNEKIMVNQEVLEDPISFNKSESTEQIPHINDVENRLECSELHWIIIYCFYVAKDGSGSFSRDEVYNKYKAKRKTTSRIGHFAERWKSLFNGIIQTVKDGEFKLTQQGRVLAIEIINGETKSSLGIIKNATTSHAKKKANKEESKEKVVSKQVKTLARTITIEAFDYDKGNKKPSLEEFLNDVKHEDNTANKILAIAYYILKYCNITMFSEGHIDYAYKVLKLSKRPTHLYQTIVNAKNENLWFERVKEAKKWKVTRAGEIYFENKLFQN